jgi:PAS domain S-box-containing protein
MAEDSNKLVKPGRDHAGIDCCGERFCDILSHSVDAIFVCDPEGTLLLANPAFETLLETRDAVGVPHDQLRPVEVAELIVEQNASVLASGKVRKFEYAVETAEGELRTFQITKGVHRDCNGQVCGVFGRVRDISERLAVEQEIIDTSDKEKQRLGREIRENFCQHLVGISLLGNALYEELARLGMEQADDARQIAQLVKEVVTEVRTVEKGLSVTHLEQGGGLVEALEDLAEQARAVGETECSFEKPSLIPVLDAKTAMYLFRIAQEAIQAVLQDTGSSNLQIQLLNKRDTVVLSVKGSEIAEPHSAALQGRLGFPMMQHRSRAIGAKLEIKEHRNREIEVICTLPKRRKHKSPSRR